MLTVLPVLERVPHEYRDHVIAMIGREFENANDGSYYGVMNAVTAVAREISDPETKWRLEEFGGSVPALARRTSRTESPREELAAV